MLNSHAVLADNWPEGGTGRYPYNRGNHLFVATELFDYGDASGKDDDPRTVVVAGFVAAPRQWDMFNAAWSKEVLGAGIAEFHSIQFFRRYSAQRSGRSKRNPFSNWSDAKARALLGALLGIIHDHRHRVVPIGCALDTKAFFDLAWGERNYLTGGIWDKGRKCFRVRTGAPSRTYHIPFFSFVSSALDKVKQPADCKVHFYMDEDEAIDNHVQDLCRWLRKSTVLPESLVRRMGLLIPAPSQDFAGIQAADLVGYLWHAIHTSGLALSGEKLYAVKSLAAIWPKECGIIRAKGLEYLLNKNLSSEDRLLVKAAKSQAQIQKLKQERRQQQQC